MKVGLYARVSKAQDQTPENQLLELRRWAQAAGHKVVGEYVDEVSSRDTRPHKEELKRKAMLGEVQGIAFVALDRWGRNISELVFEMEEFNRRGVALISLKEGLSFDSAAGKLFGHLLAAFANFERERIRERTIAGLERAKAWGKKLGRPKGAKDKKKRKKKTSPEKPAWSPYSTLTSEKPDVISTNEGA